MEESGKLKETRGTKFVNFILQRMKASTAVGAALRRADNPATEYQSWEYLAHWCDLENKYDRTSYIVVAAGLAHAKEANANSGGIGQAIALSYPDRNQDDSAKRKLRRLLACDDKLEVAQWLRPILRLAQSRGVRVNFAKLLDDLIYFGPRVKERWASEFYGKKGGSYDSISTES